MFAYLIRRLLTAIPTVFVIVTVAFFLIRVAPGGPFDLERPLQAQVMANLERMFHLNEPLLAQYWYYLQNVAVGDFGPSFIYRDFSVAELILDGLPVSVQLGGFAPLLALAVGIPAGTVAALNCVNRATDYAVMGVAMLGVTIPNFVLAPVLSLVIGVYLGWLPAGGWGDGAIANKVLPIVTLAMLQIAIIARLTRGSMLEALRSNHVRTARAYGLRRTTVVVVHALRGALLPVVSYLGPAAAALLTGSVVIEVIFEVPGVGRYFVQGALNRDYTLVMGTVVLIAIFIIVFNLLVDLAYSLIDPRVRYD
ncbi:MAG: ABC transporter permease subunit [Alphaproteobacteria bacterium]